MKTVLSILFGLVLGVTSVIVGVYLGLVLNGPPDLKTAIKVLLILAITQWVSFISFRRRIVLQVLVGAVLCVGLAIGFLTRLPIFWEHEDEPFVYSITWRSGVAFLIMLVLSQGVSYFVFRWIRSRRWTKRVRGQCSARLGPE
jgi:hypothetical protein